MPDARDDEYRDPPTGRPGAHPVGTGVGAAGGAAAGLAAGAPFGPIGMLVGAAVGALAGGAAGNAIAEQVDPAAELDWWRTEHESRHGRASDFDTDWAPAYRLGIESRNAGLEAWDESQEAALQERWSGARGGSRLEWQDARHAVRESWDRADRTYRSYAAADARWQDEHTGRDYYDAVFDFEDYRPAYRFGTWARAAWPDRPWDEALERDLAPHWANFRGRSRLDWAQAKPAVRDGWRERAAADEPATPADAGRAH